jgi:hypothetical protein
LVVIGFGLSPDSGTLSGEDGGWSPSTLGVVVNASRWVSPVGCAVVYTVAPDIFEARADSMAVAAWEEWGSFLI